MTEQLKPCPFCNNSSIVVTKGIHHTWNFLICYGCGAHGPQKSSKDSAIKAWNTRASISLLNPDMPTQELRLHMGELTNDEVMVARAAIRWANSKMEESK